MNDLPLDVYGERIEGDHQLDTGAQAEDGEPASCANISELAATVMERRQQGVAMSRMMSLAEGEGPTYRLIEAMIVSAYKTPRFDTPSYQQRQVADFRDAWHLQCVRSR